MRYEKKFVLKNAHRDSLVGRLYSLPFAIREHHSDRRVNSVYFDDPASSSVNDQKEGYGKRAKFRIRWYGDSGLVSKPKFEIKSKLGFVGSKIRSDFVGSNISLPTFMLDWHNLIANKEFSVLAKAFGLQPVVLISYRRKYLITQNSVRVTVDDEIAFRGIKIGGLYTAVLKTDDIVTEIKYKLDEEKVPFIIGQKLNLRYAKYSKFAKSMEMLAENSYI